MPRIAHEPPTLTFWIGRAGTGKTHALLTSVAQELTERPRGAPLLIITPDQASAQTERRLLELAAPGEGFTRARVLSFAHLTREALANMGGRSAEHLSATGRIMLLRRALTRLQPQLKMFRRGAETPGFAAALSEALAEFEQYGWSPDQLGAAAARARAEAAVGDEQANRLAPKLEDLHALWEAYADDLAQAGLADPAAQHLAALEALAAWPHLDGALVWIDGFYTFTHHELELVGALGRRVDAITVSLTADPAPLLNAPTRPRSGPERLFENVELLWRQMTRRAEGLAWRHQVIPFPYNPATPSRFAESPALAHLESRVLGRMKPEVFAPLLDPEQPAIELIEAEDRRAELEAVARRIVALCRRDAPAPPDAEPLSWRSVGVLARDLEPYATLLPEVFGQFNIPYFLDRPAEVRGHPLNRLLISALAVLRSGFAGERVRAHLKTGLAGLRDEDAIGRLENWILESDPTGNGWRQTNNPDPRVAAALAPFGRAEEPLRRLERNLRAALAGVREMTPARALWQYLSDVQAGHTLEQWIARERAAGNSALAQIHEQAWKELSDWLDDLEQLTPALAETHDAVESLPGLLDELTELLEAALIATKARLIPPTLNQVTVGAVDRTRLENRAVVFVLGMNLGELPRFYGPDPILGDEEREALGALERRLGPTSRQKRLHEQFLCYMALTRASQQLVLSRTLKDANGAATDPSPLFLLVAEHFKAPRETAGRGGMPFAAGVEELARPDRLPLRPEEWALRLASAYRALGGPATLAAMARLLRAGDPLDAPGLDPAVAERLGASRRRLIEPLRAELDRDLAHAALGGGRALAVTALEHLTACPFRFFAHTLLGLQARRGAEISAMDLGALRHALLDALFKQFHVEGELDWGELDLAAADEATETWLEVQATNPRWINRLGRPGLDRASLLGAARDLKFFIRALKAMGQRTRFRQVLAEWTFGGPHEGEPSIPALELSGGDLGLFVRGQIDRVDLADIGGQRVAVLIDYKTGARRMDVTRLAHALELQLPLYAAAFARHFNPEASTRVGGVFYWPLKLDFLEPGVLPGLADADDVAPWLRRKQLAGWFEEDIAAALDGQIGPGEAALAFPFKRTKQNALDNRAPRHWPPGTLAAFAERQLAMVATQLGTLAEGQIGLRPWRIGAQMACETCDFTALCRHREMGATQPRDLPTISRDDLLGDLPLTRFLKPAATPPAPGAETTPNQPPSEPRRRGRKAST